MTSRTYAEVIGDPIAHSKSPLVHRFWLEKLGIDADYRATRVSANGLATFVEARRRDPDWRGCNVTIPLKAAVVDLVQDPLSIRVAIGAMNTIVREQDESVWGTNTDPKGFLEPIAVRDWRGQSAVVIGAGGAAKAVLFALAEVGIGSVTILNRSPDKAAVLLESFGLAGGAVPLDAPLPAAALLVNASALGMTGQPPLVVDLAPLPAAALVYDLVYAPFETSLLAQARARGMETVDGLHMLVGQAAIAFEQFFGRPAPRQHDAELRALLLA